MITIVLYNGEWHIMNRHDGVILCRLSLGEFEWDAPIQIDDDAVIDSLEDRELCALCLSVAHAHDAR